MVVLVGLIPLTVGYVGSLLALIGLSEYPVVSNFFSSFAVFFFAPVEVAVISIAFRELTNWTPSPSQLEETPIA